MPYRDQHVTVRLERIEKALIDAGLLKLAGEEIRDGLWTYERTAQGIAWTVNFDYRCNCKKVHDAKVQIPVNSADGQICEVEGPCGKKSEVRIWKTVARESW